MDRRLRRSPPDRASAVPYGQAGENAVRFPHLAHRSAAAHKLHSTPQQHGMKLISGNGETSSRLPAFSLFLPGSCPNYRDRRSECSSQFQCSRGSRPIDRGQAGPAAPLYRQPSRGHRAQGPQRLRLSRSQRGAVRDPEALQRIKSLAIPPVWSAVWISPDPLGHLQVTGRDQRGSKQYRYHARWRAVRDEAKYGKTLTFARVLPSIRARVDADLRRHGLPRERVLAADGSPS